MKREETITITVSQKEKQEIQQRAVQEGLTMSAYIRFQLMKKGGKN